MTLLTTAAPFLAKILFWLLVRVAQKTYNMGAAQETIVANTGSYDVLAYGSSSAGVVVNLDSVSHSFTNSLGNQVTVASYSGLNKQATAADAKSYSTGDIYEPVSGTGTSIDQINGSSYGDYIYEGSSSVNVYEGGGTNYLFGGSGNLSYWTQNGGTTTTVGGSGTTYYGGGNGNVTFTGGTGAVTYNASSGTDKFVGGSGNDLYSYWNGAHTAQGGSGTNIFYANSGFNMNVYLNASYLVGGTPAYTHFGIASMTSGGVTYSSFVFGYNNAMTASPGGTTLFKTFENVYSGAGNDTIVGDNNGNQINAETGNNTIILGSGTNIVTAIQGTNAITSAGTMGHQYS